MYQICVSGAAKGDSVEEGRQLAARIGTDNSKSWSRPAYRCYYRFTQLCGRELIKKPAAQ